MIINRKPSAKNVTIVEPREGIVISREDIEAGDNAVREKIREQVEAVRVSRVRGMVEVQNVTDESTITVQWDAVHEVVKPIPVVEVTIWNRGNVRRQKVNVRVK